MTAISIADVDNRCLNRFHEMGQVYHVCTPENYPVIFSTREDFSVGMSVLAACARLFPTLKILTFQIMSNHIHIVVAGQEADVLTFFEMFKSRLKKNFEHREQFLCFKNFIPKLFKIDSLENMRNVIAYVNRNGSVINPDVTPFSYSWGANSFYFQPQVCFYEKLFCKPVSVSELRRLLHSKVGDKIDGLMKNCEFISPLSFCDIDSGEAMFRNARQFFYYISRNVEAYQSVAAIIGEDYFMTDDDIYLAIRSLSKNLFDVNDPKLLPLDQKMQIAKRLHYDYHSGNNQIQRMLKIDRGLLDSMFGVK